MLKVICGKSVWTLFLVKWHLKVTVNELWASLPLCFYKSSTEIKRNHSSYWHRFFDHIRTERWRGFWPRTVTPLRTVLSKICVPTTTYNDFSRVHFDLSPPHLARSDSYRFSGESLGGWLFADYHSLFFHPPESRFLPVNSPLASVAHVHLTQALPERSGFERLGHTCIKEVFPVITSSCLMPLSKYWWEAKWPSYSISVWYSISHRLVMLERLCGPETLGVVRGHKLVGSPKTNYPQVGCNCRIDSKTLLNQL